MTTGQLSAAVTAQTIRVAAIACAVLGLLALAALSIAGRPLAGVALAVGLALGSVNGLLASKLIGFPLPFMASSLARLITLSMIGVAIGFALGVDNIWLVIMGLAAAQFVLALSALRLVARR